ncbi:hypothetical protein [Pseudomonas chlororaphis]|uniref:hypothetical protein n=1 Tax=Pseudomonas chlororaphis TaxID=587753 RepID=UPI0037C56D99
MNINGDFREEYHTTLYRTWMLIDKLGKNKKGDPILSLDKASILDLIIKNPSLLKKARNYIGTPDTPNEIGDILYNTNLAQSHKTRKRSFLTTALLLSEMGLIELKKINSEYFVSCIISPSEPDNDLINQLTEQILSIKGLVSKSASVITNNILGE